MPLSREHFQRIALVTLVLLLAAVASDRLMRMVTPAFAHDRFVHAHAHGWEHPDFELPELAEMHAELAAEAALMEEEIRVQIEEARLQAEEHWTEGEERCQIERELHVEVR